ncbi:MAG: toll/interleukin-1 receptor domain-containing protein [Methylotenera sp.]|nr:toll/interleukin-1 receptor domain-containing protein [Methylotenera sp.]
MPTLVFSYSHADEELRNRLEIHLASLKRQGLIDTWHDRRIAAGQEFSKEISNQFENADIVLLLVSPDFIASDYCFEIEMKRALQRHENGEAIVIPIILRPCDWHDLPFGKLLAATADGKPIIHFPTYDDGFLQVVQAIKTSIGKLNRKSLNTEVLVPKQNEIAQSIPKTINRSSNLRIKKAFTDREYDLAQLGAIEYISGYFENSLQELEKRNHGIETQFKRVDANSFEASVYAQGKRICQCGIWIANNRMGHELYFSLNGITHNSYNESMSIADDGYSLGFKPLMSFSGRGEQLLGNEGVAEHFWTRFIEPLQR